MEFTTFSVFPASAILKPLPEESGPDMSDVIVDQPSVVEGQIVTKRNGARINIDSVVSYHENVGDVALSIDSQFMEPSDLREAARAFKQLAEALEK